jgi:hypothetical protein
MTGIILQAGYDFIDILNQLEYFGFFQYILPFLLIFALVYAILSKLNVFQDNKGASVIVAFAIGLLALQLDFVSIFFQQIFPRFGVGLSVFLVALILMGAFLPINKEGKPMNWIFFMIGGIIFLFVVGSSFNTYSSLGYGFWQQYGALLILLAILVGAIVAVTRAGA